MIASIVDTDALLQVIWVSLLAGVGVPACYGLAILGSTRAIEFGRDGLGVVIASIVFGILTLVND